MPREIVVALTMLSFAAAQTAPIIDIVDVAPRNRIHEPATVSVSGGRSGGDLAASPQDSFLKIEILSARVVNDAPEPSMIFEVRLRNSGQEKVAIPTDPNLADFEPERATSSYSYMSAHVFVVVEETKGILQGVSLFGSQDVAGSLRDLHSGESIEIRARTPLKPVYRNIIPNVSSRSSVRAGILMQRNAVSQQGETLHEDSRQISPEIMSPDAVLLLGS
jgi:hypothetical protein